MSNTEEMIPTGEKTQYSEKTLSKCHSILNKTHMDWSGIESGPRRCLNKTSNSRYNLFSKENPIIRIFCISGCLAVPINSDKWRSVVLNTEEIIPKGEKNAVLGENPVQVPVCPKQNSYELVRD